MEASDYGHFETAFKRLSTALRFKLTAGGDTLRTYFQLLESYPVDRVVAAAQRCGQTRVMFPKPAEWIAEIERGSVAPQDVRQMTVDELNERERAERLKYHDAPCGCRECFQAGVSEQELRYVPTEFFDGEYERAFNPRRKWKELAGHWAHGAELARWYAARAACHDQWSRATVKFPKLAALLASREPGQEG